MRVVAPFPGVAATGRSLFTTCRGCWGQPPGGVVSPQRHPIMGRPPFIKVVQPGYWLYSRVPYRL